MATEKPARITLDVNVTAPSFELKDIYDRTINLQDYKGKKVFLAFFRHAGCPYCNLRVHMLSKKADELKAKNMEMIFFFQSPQRLLLASSFHQGVSPVPLIADPEAIWYQTYGIENSVLKSAVSHLTTILQTSIKAKMKGLPVHTMAANESITTMPAEFLIDEKSIIRRVHYANGLNDRMSMEHIEAFANQ
jgi:thioredoxin-dependent peroxiredoxin